MNNFAIIEFGIFIALVTFLIINQFRGSLQQLPEERSFMKILKVLVVLIFVEVAVKMNIPDNIFPKEFKYILNLINDTCILFIPYLWNRFIHYKVYGSSYFFRKYIIPITMPLIMGVLFSLTREHQIYLAQSSLKNVEISYVTTTISILYLLMASVISFLSARKNNTKTGRHLEMYFCWIMIIPIIAIIVQTFIITNSIPIIYPVFMLVFLHIYVSQQNTFITLDYLTGLNNERRLNTYLRDKVSNQNSEQRLFLLIITLDNMSLIRRKFGKKKANEIIVSFADFLRSMMTDNSFLAYQKKYTFAIVLEKKSWEKTETFCNTLIQKSLNHHFQKIIPWQETFSINYSEFGKPGVNNVIALLNDTRNNCFKPTTTINIE